MSSHGCCSISNIWQLNCLFNNSFRLTSTEAPKHCKKQFQMHFWKENTSKCRFFFFFFLGGGAKNCVLTLSIPTGPLHIGWGNNLVPSATVDQDPCHHMVSQNHNDLNTATRTELRSVSELTIGNPYLSLQGEGAVVSILKKWSVLYSDWTVSWSNQVTSISWVFWRSGLCCTMTGL